MEELWTVGGIEGEGWETFSDRLSLSFDDAGRLKIYDGLTEKIHLVAPDGSLQRSWGEQGEGPGELASPMSMISWRDGSSAVMDLGKMGYVRFDPEGEYIEDVRIDPAQGIPGFTGLLPHPSGDVISDGGGMVIRRSGPGGSEADLPADPGIAITRYSLTGAAPTTVHRAWDPPEPEGGSDVSFGGGGMTLDIQMPTPIAFQPELHFGVLPDGRIAVVDSTTWTIELISADGTILDTISRPVPPIVVTEEIQTAERERRRTELEAQAEEGGGGGGGAIGGVMMIRGDGGGSNAPMSFDMSGLTENRLEQLDGMLFGPEIPVIGQLSVDWDGRIWVERANVDPTEDGPIDIVSTAGQYVGTLPMSGPRIPVAFGPGGLAAYIDQDEFDVPTVRVVRMTGFPG